MRERLEQSGLDLDRECGVLGRYLTGESPSRYVLEKYRDAHARNPRLHPGAAIDRFLLRIACGSGPGAWLVDCYTAIFFKGAAVRRKSVLVVAILESSAPAADMFDAPDHGTIAGLVARMSLRGVLFAIGVLSSMFVIAPVHALLAVRSKWTA